MKTNLKKMKIEDYQGNFNKNYEILKNGGAVRITTISGSGKWTKYFTCQYPSFIEGYDLILMNDAPRGGKLGNYIAATKSGDKTVERAAFVKAFRKNWAKKIYKESVNKPENILAAIKKAVEIVNPNVATDERYWINIYHGCGVYRLVIKDGKIVAGIKGGFHNSCPYLVDVNEWVKALINYIYEIFGNDVSIVKADGSGTYFFIRNFEDADKIENKQYIVPAINNSGNLGNYHLNIEIV